MKNLFEQSRSHWVRYDHYELKTAEDGKRYITPGKSAKPDVYNPLKEVPNIVLDALNVGMLMMGRKPEAEVEKAIMEFITRYLSLIHIYTALLSQMSWLTAVQHKLFHKLCFSAPCWESLSFLCMQTVFS